jgi:amino acid transporter
MTHKTISPLLATIININIVVGGAFFLSSETVVQASGAYAPLVWLCVGLLLFPLMKVLATLSIRYPVSGGLYVYSAKLLSPFLGFLSGCGYFLGTAAGNALIIYSFRMMLQMLFIPSLTPSQGLASDIFLILFFAFLNSKNIDFLGPLQTAFTVLKTVPFLVVIGGAFFLFKFSNIASLPIPNVFSFMQGIPLVLFAYIGIEACCSIGHVIKNGEKNTSRVLFISLAIIVALYSIIQYLIIGIH